MSEESKGFWQRVFTSSFAGGTIAILIFLVNIFQGLGKVMMLTLTVATFIYIIINIFWQRVIVALNQYVFNNQKDSKEGIGSILLLLSIIVDVLYYPAFESSSFTDEVSVIKLLYYCSLVSFCLFNLFSFVPEKQNETWDSDILVVVLSLLIVLINYSISASTSLFDDTFPFLPLLAIMLSLAFLSPSPKITKFALAGFLMSILSVLFAVLASAFYAPMWGTRISILSSLLLIVTGIGFWSKLKPESRSSLYSVALSILIIIIYINVYKAPIVSSIELYFPMIQKSYDSVLVFISSMEVLFILGTLIYTTNKNHVNNEVELPK